MTLGPSTLSRLALPALLLVLAAAVPAVASAGACTSSATTLCLQADRFQVEVDWVDTPDSGAGTVFQQFSDDTGFFYFRDPNVVENIVKVFDGCAFNDRYWVSVANVSNLGQTLTVTDLNLGNQTQYFVNEGTYGQPVIDTNALPCDPTLQPTTRERALPTTEGGGTDHLFLDQRFRVEVAWEDFGGGTGMGNPVFLTERSGAFWTFDPSNLEILAKIVPDTTSGFYTFVFSSVANIELDVTVTDTCSGAVQTYNQPLGTSSTVADTTAFAIACTESIFGDGFESGDATAWSSTVP